MSRPKEPNFFSDDRIYARGWRWYSSLFAQAGESDLRGESSTHYTKLPDYPHTVARMIRDLPEVKLIYLMRHPIDRLMSHYVHELTTGRIKVDVDHAIERHHELIEYSRYAMQLGPFVDAYGFENILPVFFPRLVRHSQAELERIGRFLKHGGPLRWDTAMKPQNRGKERLRPSPIRQALVQAPVLSALRQCVVPRQWTESLKEFWRAQIEPPALDQTCRRDCARSSTPIWPSLAPGWASHSTATTSMTRRSNVPAIGPSSDDRTTILNRASSRQATNWPMAVHAGNGPRRDPVRLRFIHFRPPGPDETCKP